MQYIRDNASVAGLNTAKTYQQCGP